MRGQRLGAVRRPVALEVGGRRADDAAVVAEPAGDQRFVVDRPQPDGQIEALPGDVDAAIGEGELQLDLGVARGELGHQGHDLAHAEAVAEADPQGAARPQPAGARQLLGGIDLVQDLARPLVEQAALGRGGYTPGGALQEPHAEPVLEPGDQLADRRGRQPQALGRGCQAALLDDLDQDGHLARPVRPVDLCHGVTNVVI